MKPHRLLKACKVIADSGPNGLKNTVLTRLAVKRMPQKVWNYPKFAQIEVTNRCNLRCEMCPLSHKEYVPLGGSRNMELTEFQKIIDQLHFLRSVRLNGLGESLLNPALPEMIKYATSKGIKVGFFTNATLLIPERARQLVSNGLWKLDISIDGGNPETYERIRRGARFSEVAENVRNMAQMKSKLGENRPYLCFWVVGMKENVKEIPRIIELASSWGVEHVTIKNMDKVEGLTGTVLTEDDIQFLHTECASAAHRLGINFSYPNFSVLDNRRLTMTCRWPWNSTYITANGFVTPCCYSPDGSLSFGNVFDTDFREIWNNEAFRDFRSQLKTGMPDICKGCPVYVWSYKTSLVHVEAREDRKRWVGAMERETL